MMNTEELTDLRAVFETLMLDVAAKSRAEGTTTDDNGCALTLDSLFWLTPEGKYGVAQFNAAWQGFVLGFTFAQAVNEIA